MSFFSACSPSLTPFTNEIASKNDFTDDELKKIQFYLSERLVLRRELGSSSSQIIGGKVKMIDGRRTEEIVIPKGTPGVVIYAPSSDRLAVSFEAGENAPYLVFGPNPRMRGRYALRARNWNRSTGEVQYGGEFFTVNYNSSFTYLLVNMKKIRSNDVKRRKVDGRTLDN